MNRIDKPWVLITLLALAGIGSSAALGANPSAANGEQLFRQRCAACHSVVPGAPAVVGPNLAGVVGRKAASTPFPTYSAALKASKFTWTRPNLDTFLIAPARMVPGTRMAVSLPDAAQRTALIQYLAARR